MVSIDKDSKITVLSGAGFSRASGIPTFRGKDGLWKKYRAEELATPSAFVNNPALVWEWYRWRIGIVLSSSSNPAHEILVVMEKKGFDIHVLTQNVDDFHERAGSTKVTHLHGKILEARCVECETRLTWTKELLKKYQIVPRCTTCDSLLRPDVVWFGEGYDRDILQACYDRLSITDLLIVAGTSGVVYPVAYFPVMVKQMNPLVKIYEFNIENTPISGIADRTILGPVEETLVAFFKEEENSW
ncbi:MAG: SIR2 family NAD-dependent protein deacylase [Candidatus Hodarchaeales archaeon]|jgi:NAD-dependent deacetylase